MQPLSLTLLLMLIVTLVATSAIGGNLYGSWSSFSGKPLTLTSIDPQTAKEGKQVISVDDVAELFAITPAIDSTNQRVFIPFLTGVGKVRTSKSDEIESDYHPMNQGAPVFHASLYAFDFSNPDAVKVLFKTPLPHSFILGVLYDPVEDGTFVIATDLDDTAEKNVYLVFVSASDGTYSNVTTFPSTLLPFGGAVGGTPVALDPVNRIIAMGTVFNRTRVPTITVYDIKTKTFTTKPNKDFWLEAIAFNSKTGEFVCILQPSKIPPFNMSVATLDPSSATYNILTTWPASNNLFFVIGAMGTMDAANDKLYSVIGNGEGPPVALVTISTVTGNTQNIAYFRPKQPQSIFYV